MVVSYFCRLFPGERAHSILRLGGWAGSSVSVEVLKKSRTVLCLLGWDADFSVTEMGYGKQVGSKGKG